MTMINLRNSDNDFESLLNCLDKSDLIRIKMELIELLELKIKQFSGGNSSVSKERGQALMDANIYIMELYLKQFETTKSIAYLKEYPVREIYEQGSKLIKQLLHYSKIEVDQFIKELVKIDLYVYHDTLIKGLPLFFNHYNFDYDPQDAILTFDYPTYRCLSNKQGIERFLEYFKFVQLENSFNQLFAIDLILEMLHYYHIDYHLLIFNVTNLLLKQLLLKQIIEGSFSYLFLTKIDLDKVISCFDSNKNIETLISQAFNELTASLRLEIQLSNYLRSGLNEVISELENNYKLNALGSELALER